MNLFLTQSPQIGAAKAYLLRQALSVAAKKANHTVVEQPKEADLVIVFGSSLTNSADLVGKKVFLANEDAAIASPEVTLTNALNQAVDYVQPVQSAVGFGGVSGVKNIVAVTACPTGVAHTFMSAEAIETYAKKQGWQVKVETRGQVGAGNETTPEESGEKKGVYKHLMTGVSHMLPLVVAGGLLIAISFMFGIEAFKDETIFHGIPKALMDIGGGAAFHLMIAVFAGYVAFSIADRPGLAVGLIGGMLATTAGAGILGGIIAGFLAGYVVKELNATIKLPASLTSLKPILILPLFGTLIVGLAMIYVINPPVSQIMTTLSDWLKSMGEVNAMVLGAIIGAMMCIDMGGPVNKAAYTFSVGMLASQVHTPMAAAMAAGMVPPIGMAIATWIARSKFTRNQRDAGKASFVLGLCFISEGALPFVAADPLRVIISSVIGGATAGAISMALNISLQAPHGGLFVIPFVSEPLLYLGAIAIGALLTGVIYAVIKPKVTE